MTIFKKYGQFNMSIVINKTIFFYSYKMSRFHARMRMYTFVNVCFLICAWACTNICNFSTLKWLRNWNKFEKGKYELKKPV
jgi:hypothetical protein